MTTVSQIITTALRQLGVVGGSGAQPSTWDSADSLFILQSLIRGLINSGAVGRMRDVVPQGSYVAGENQRVFRTQDDPTQQIELPDLIGSHENIIFAYGRTGYDPSNTRPPRDGAFVSIVDSISGGVVDYVYDGQQKRWVSIGDLAVPNYDDSADAQAQLATVLAMDCPFSFGDPNGLSAYLATQLAPQFGGTIPPATAEASRNFLIALTHSYSTRDYGHRDQRHHNRGYWL